MATALAALGTAPAALAGPALPDGGQVVAGQAAIASGAGSVTINQSSARGIIDWNSFSIGKGGSVTFNNGSGATLNRVTGALGSQIDGALNASGSVFLINPNGIVVGADGKIVTGGSFIGSTRDISNSDFLSGGDSSLRGSSNGTIENTGTIQSQTGDVVLVGKAVNNSGSIEAKQGHVALGAGDDVLLQKQGSDQRIAIKAGSGDVTNSGAIDAAAAELKAAGGNVYALAGNNGGIIRATGTTQTGGHIWLTAKGGAVQVSGKLTTTIADGKGGAVTVRAGDIDVSGAIDASATKAGKSGGDVSIIAKNTTNFSGTIKSEGGAGGHGGQVETSGAHLHVADSARVSTLSKNGDAGLWLLDPNDFTIAASGGDMTGATLSTNLDGGPVAIATATQGTPGGNGDIFVNDAVSWSADNTLTLNAERNIEINANLTATGTSAGVALNPGLGGTGNYVLNGGAITLSGASASFTVNGTAYTLIHDVNDLQGMKNDLAGNYALGNDIDASGATGFTPVGSGVNPFMGTLDGLNHDIGGLSVTGTSYVGLFGKITGGTVSNLGLTQNTTAGSFYVGALAGSVTGGTFFNVHTSGNVTASYGYVGGLIGYSNNASVTQAYSTGTVVTGDGGTIAGGLIGQAGAASSLTNVFSNASVSGRYILGGLVGSSSGNITNAYATGAVTGIASNSGTAPGVVGGLIGAKVGGTVTNVYATGLITGVTPAQGLGGVAGNNGSGTLSNAYWDTDTSTSHYGGGTAKHTAELQGTLPTGFDSSVWGTGDGLYPYFKWQYATAPQAVSGIAYSDGGTTGMAGAHISAISNGALLGSGTTGANGYFYILNPAGTVNSAGAFAYLDDEAIKGGAFSDIVTATSVSGLNIYGTSLDLVTGAASLDATRANLNTTVGSYSDTDIRFFDPISTYTASGYGTYLNASASGYTINHNLVSGGLLSLDGSGSYTINGLTALTAHGKLALNSDFAWSGTAILSLAVIEDISLNGAITAANGTLMINGQPSSVITAGGSVDVNQFNLIQGNWSQIGASLPSFSATDFRINPANASFLRATGGDGTTATPYQIADVYGLQGIASLSLFDSNFVLVNDIDASGTANWNSGAGFLPIGTDSAGNILVGDNGLFTGAFDGGNHTISGLTIDRPSASYVGLFGIVERGSSLSNLTINGGTVSGQSYVGALVGYADGPITNVHVSAAVRNTGDGFDIGGLAGYSNNAISLSSASGSVTVGGMGSDVGGLVGEVNGTIDQSYATGNIIVGGAANQNFYAGGLAGESFDAITRSFATGNVTTGGNVAGGLVGTNYGTLENVYATGNVTADSYAGGLVGIEDGISSISNAYSTGTPLTTGYASAGGSIGLASVGASTTFSNVFWDQDTSGTNNAIGYNYDSSFSGIIGATTAQMHDLATFAGAGWDIDDAGGTSAIWRIYDGNTAPLLRAFLTPLTVTAGNVSKTYDGAAYSGGYSATYSDPSASLSGTLGSNLAGVTDAGSHAIRGLYSDQFGYDIAFAGTLTIDPRILTATFAANNKIYDGTTDDTGSVSVSNMVSGDTVSASGIFAFADKNAGTGKAVNVTGLTLSGADAGNYTLASASGTTTADIAKAPLNITANDDSKAYDSTAYSGGNGVSYGGFAQGEDVSDLSGTLSYGGSAQGAVNAGSYTITASGLSSANYTLTYTPGTLTIGTVALSITPDAASKVYGDTLSLSGFDANGLQGSDSIGSLILTSAGVAASANAGAYDITPSGLVFATGSASNYTVTYNVLANGLTVTPRPVTVSADNLSRVYGDANPALTYAVISGNLVNGDTLSGTLSTNAVTASDVGTYAIAQGNLRASGNYTVSFTPGRLTINPRTLTASFVANGKTYDATTAATGTVNLGNVVNADVLSASAVFAFGDANAGTDKAVSVTGVSFDGAKASNYVLAATSGSTTATIAKAPLTITAEDVSADTLADAKPVMVFDGLLGGDTVSVVSGLTIDYLGTSDPALYTIAPSGGSAVNYALSYVNGTLSLTGESTIDPFAVLNTVFNAPDRPGQASWSPQVAVFPVSSHGLSGLPSVFSMNPLMQANSDTREGGTGAGGLSLRFTIDFSDALTLANASFGQAAQ